MIKFTPLRTLPTSSDFKENDVLVLFGELFRRGYANGVIDLARSKGMKIIGATVGRRDENKLLRPLTDEELQAGEENLGGKIINIPLEAGFTLDSKPGQANPEEQLTNIKLVGFEKQTLDWDNINDAREVGANRFRTATREFSTQLKTMIPEGANVYFVHTMAGGVPKSRNLAPIMNRVFKGTGNRYISSKALWECEIGKLIAMNFEEVTANTFSALLDMTEDIRNMVSEWNGKVFYSAYGYHGNEILVDDQYQWQSYCFYAQGEAKMKLEQYAIEARKKGIAATIFNCPEIGTNSTDIFPGVEVSLYLLLRAVTKEGGGAWAEEQVIICKNKLTESAEFDSILGAIEANRRDPFIQSFQGFNDFPIHHNQKYADQMIELSKFVVEKHKSRDDLIIDHTSRLIYESTGRLIFNHIWNVEEAVIWLGHDIIAKELISIYAK